MKLNVISEDKVSFLDLVVYILQDKPYWTGMFRTNLGTRSKVFSRSSGTPKEPMQEILTISAEYKKYGNIHMDHKLVQLESDLNGNNVNLKIYKGPGYDFDRGVEVEENFNKMDPEAMPFIIELVEDTVSSYYADHKMEWKRHAR